MDDCAAAIQNILLAAHALGLGAVWCGLEQREENTKVLAGRLGVPDKILPMGMIALGHPAESREPKERYEPAKLHWEKW